MTPLSRHNPERVVLFTDPSERDAQGMLPNIPTGTTPARDFGHGVVFDDALARLLSLSVLLLQDDGGSRFELLAEIYLQNVSDTFLLNAAWRFAHGGLTYRLREMTSDGDQLAIGTFYIDKPQA